MINIHKFFYIKIVSFFIYFALCSAMIFSTKIVAEQLSMSSYKIEMSVKDYSDSERNKAFADGYKKLLQEQSNQNIDFQDNEIKNRLKNISDWVQSYNYTRHNDQNGKIGLFLNINFAPSSMPNMLNNMSSDKASDSISNNISQNNNSVDLNQQINVPTDVHASINQQNDAKVNQSSVENSEKILEKTLQIATSNANQIHFDQAQNSNQEQISIPLPKKQSIIQNNSSLLNANATSNSTLTATTLPVNSSTISTLSSTLTSTTKTPITATPISSDALLWFVVITDTPEKNIFLDETSKNPLVTTIVNQAKNLGLDVVFPTMDLEDLTKITSDDICNLDRNVIQEASLRYNTKNVIVACVKDVKPQLHSEWLFFNRSQNTNSNSNDIASSSSSNQFSFDANNLDNIITQGFSKIHDVMSNKNINSSSNNNNNDNSHISDVNSNNSTTQPSTSTPEEKTIIIDNIANQIQPSSNVASTTTASSNNNMIATSNANNVTNANTLGNENNFSNNSNTANITKTNSFTQTSQPLTSDQVLIYIHDVANIEQYSLAVKYLKNLPQVKQVELQNIQGTTIKLKVTIPDGKYALSHELDKQQKLKPNNEVLKDEPNVLNYNWQTESNLITSPELENVQTNLQSNIETNTESNTE